MTVFDRLLLEVLLCPTRLDPAANYRDLARGLTETIARASVVLDAIGANGEEPPSLPAAERESEPIWWTPDGIEGPLATGRGRAR